MADEGGRVWFEGLDDSRAGARMLTAWVPVVDSTDYFDPSDEPFMINLRVRGLDDLLGRLRADGVEVDPPLEE